MATLRYLTVPDFLWLSQELTKSVQKYSYATLEEGVFYQYGHGTSVDVAGQAARLLVGFPKMAPFAKANEALALAGCIAFLRMNHRDLNLGEGEAADWVRAVWANPASAREAVESRLVDSHLHDKHGVPPTKKILAGVLKDFGPALASLMDSEAPRALA
ncbi:MAG: hypothetical protein MH204_04195 [Fimbriimonadaceae bacterium]|nr:hypothetical protein [Fimbriimonadaceae bacterium]